MLIVRPASAAEVRPVQMQVLRPHGPLPGDRPFPSDWHHLAAVIGDQVIGACSLGPAAWPREDLAHLVAPHWQVRSLAVVPAHRGGVGSALVAACTDLAADQGVGSVWATARVAALSLYERAGWRVLGPEWDKPGVGPHKYVVRLIG